MRLLKKLAPAFCAMAAASIGWAQSTPTPNQLPTGKQITPTGTQFPVGSLPMNMILDPTGTYVIVSDMGFRQYLTCLRTSDGKIAQPFNTGKPPTNESGISGTGVPASTSPAQLQFPAAQNGNAFNGSSGLYYGLAITATGANTSTIYASQGALSTIAVVSLDANGNLTQTGLINMQKGDFPAGLSLDSKGRLYVAVNQYYAGSSAASATTPGSLVIYDTTASGVITAGTKIPTTAAPELARIPFTGAIDTFGTVQVPSNNSARPGPAAPFTPPNYPFAVAALSTGTKVYVSSQRDGVVFSIGLNNLASPTVTPITTGSHPVSLLLNKAQTTLFVANAQSDTISEVNTSTDTVFDTVVLRPAAAAALPGVTPTGLALSTDENTLYATLGDMNAVAVVDPNPASSTPLLGYIPVGWYPTSLVALPGANPKGNVLMVANGKGTNTSINVTDSSGNPVQGNPNPKHITELPPPAPQYEDTYYVPNIIEGTVSRFDTSDPTFSLATASTQVILNNQISAITAKANPITPQAQAGIKHVIYIIKENRTYDQVLGDIPGGNGDSTLTVFGPTVTPNLHNIAQRFVLLDNFYDCAEVSGDGWNWSTQSYANEQVIKNVPYEYSNRGRNYDYEGQNNNLPVSGFPAKGPDGNTLSPLLFPNGQPPFPDVSTNPNGYIWDLANKAGKTYRNYGMFCNNPGVRNAVPDNFPNETNLLPGGHYTGGLLDPVKNGHTDIDFRRFDTNYADSDGPSAGGHPFPLPTFGKFNANSRFAEWNREFQLMIAADATGNNVPNLMLLRLMSDHTAGYSTGKPTPTAMVADNDYAVGQVVQAVRNSPIWSSTAIFVLEDDAQDGPDHVDAHRSTCYVISPWIKANSIDHTFYNTDSVLRTMEILLGLPPMSQYDAAATPIGNWDSAPNNNAAFTATPAATSIITQLAQKDLKPGDALYELAMASAKLDFSREDAAPASVLNAIIWKSVKGVDSVPPQPRHGLIVAPPQRPGVKAPAKAPRHDDDDD